MKDVLCIGATGMLAGCVRALVQRGNRVAAIARSPERLRALSDSIGATDRARLSTHPCDYRSPDELKAALDAITIEPAGAICWVHTPAEAVLARVRHRYPKIDLLRVVGSTTQIAQPGPISGPQPAEHADRIVRLGFVIEDDRSRWLTHEEISSGVLDVFVRAVPSALVGVVEPWDRRP